MIEYAHPLGWIMVPDRNDSLDSLWRLAQSAPVWAADTETTGLNMYAADFQVRIVQVGTTDEAWILRPDFPEHREAIARLTKWQRSGMLGERTWYHNWVFDGLCMETSLGLDFDETYEGVHDTDITSRLVDPRPPHKGGVGHKLKDLGDQYVMKGVKDAREVVLAEGKRIFGPRVFTKDNMWSMIPVDNEVYLRYAGQDVFLTARLAPILWRKVEEKGIQRFAQFERQLSRRLAYMQRIGIAFDTAWAKQVEAEYEDIYQTAEAELKDRFKVPPTKSSGLAHSARTALIQRFEELGAPQWEKMSEKTGKPSLDKSVIGGLTLAPDPEVAAMAKAVQAASRNKHYGDYIRGMRERLGKDGRLHPSIRPMQAATHRMSVADPPIQQFPRDDSRVRGCLAADPGHVILTADYAQIEYRVAAAVSQDPEMIRMIVEGEDLHSVAAAAVFGSDVDFTSPEGKKMRQACKPIGLGRLYLGGALGIWTQMAESDTTGYLPTLPQVVVGGKAFDGRFRVYNRYALRLKDKVEKAGGLVVTATGRQLRTDKAYTASNYMIQSTARDLFAAAVNRIHAAGLGKYLRLVVHDEIVLSIPERQAEKIAAQVVGLMQTEFKGVPIETEAEIKGKRWSK